MVGCFYFRKAGGIYSAVLVGSIGRYCDRTVQRCVHQRRQQNEELRAWKNETEPKMTAIIQALNKFTGEEIK